MRFIRNQTGGIRWGAIAPVVVLVGVLSGYVFAAADAATHFTKVRIGQGSTPDITLGNDDLFVEGTIEVDGELQVDGVIDLNSTLDIAGDAVFNEDVSLCVGTDDKVTFTSGYFTKFRIGTGDTPGITLGADDAFIEGSLEVNGETQCDGILDANSTSNFADTATFSKGSGDAVDISSGGALNNDGTLDQNGNADFAGNAVFSGSSKTISFASALDANAGADVGGAALNCSFAGNGLTAGNGVDMEWQGFVSIGDATPDGLTDGTDDALYVENNFEVDGTIYADGAIDADSTSDFADTATFSKGSGDAVDISSGGALNIDGTVDCNGNADFAENVVFSGSSKTISFASALDVNAGADVGGAALNCSFAGNCLTSANTSDIEWLGFASFGNGTPDAVTDGTAEDVYIEGGLEVDAAVTMQGTWSFDNIASKTAAYAPAAATTDGILLVTGASGGWTYAYPEEDCDEAADVGRIIIVKCAASGATGCGSRNIAITPETATIDGQATRTLTADWQSWTILCGAVNTLYIL